MSADKNHTIEWTDEQISSLWDWYAKDPATDDFYFSRRFGSHILALCSLVKVKSLRVLDFGCGRGFMLDAIRARGRQWQYYGLDFSEKSIEILQLKKPEAAILASHLPTELPEDSFDLITLIEVIEHLDDEKLWSTLLECKRLLRPGGVLLITTPNAENLEKSMNYCPECGAIYHRWQHQRSWTITELLQYTEEKGFVTKRVRACTLFGKVPIMTKLMTLAFRILGKKQLNIIAEFVKP